MPPPPTEEIYTIGELIRLKLHKDPLMIKDRRYHLRTYSCCFIGKELIEWLIKNGEVLNQNNAIACMRMLQDNGILHHVCDDHVFKNEYLFYRFRIDDGTFFVNTEYEQYHQAIMLHQRILGDSENMIMEDKVTDDSVIIKNCFTASEFVNWLVINDVVRDRYAGAALGQQFLNIMVIKPVGCEPQEFFDDAALFRFVFDLDCPLPLYKLLNLGDEEPSYKNMDESMRKLALSAGKRDFMARLWNGGLQEEIIETVSENHLDENENQEEEMPHLKSVLLRQVRVNELMNKESPYYWKNIRITSDAVGFGFIIRGEGPCYVQAMDPSGPAASAGLRLRMYIYSVNGKKVLDMDHREVAQEIMKGVVVDLVVLQHFRISN